jgi:hypothetical protein
VSLVYTPCLLGLHPFTLSNKIELLIKKKQLNNWTICIQGVYKKDTKTKEKQKIEEEHPKNPKDSRKVTSNPKL